MTFPGAVQASDSPPMPRLSLVEQVQGEGRGHCGGDYRAGEHDDLGEEDGNSRTGVMRLWQILVCLLDVFPKMYLTLFLLSSTQ